MEALKSCYGDGSSDSDSESVPSAPTSAPSAVFTPLPPPPISLLEPSTFIGIPGFKLVFIYSLLQGEKRMKLLSCLIGLGDPLGNNKNRKFYHLKILVDVTILF